MSEYAAIALGSVQGVTSRVAAVTPGSKPPNANASTEAGARRASRYKCASARPLGRLLADTALSRENPAPAADPAASVAGRILAVSGREDTSRAVAVMPRESAA